MIRRFGTVISIIAVAALFIGLAILAHEGTRGSDGFWYLQEIETLVNDNTIESNIYYSGTYWRSGFNEENNYFIHHTLAHHLVLPFAKIFGSYSGWFIANALFAFLGSILIGLAITNSTGSVRMGVLISSIYLLLPNTIWQSFNILQEGITASYMCLLVFIWERTLNSTNKSTYYFIGGLLGAIGILVHPIFLIWSFGLIIQLAISYKGFNKYKLGILFTVILGLIITTNSLKEVILPGIYTPASSLSDILSVSAGDNMSFYMDYTLAVPTYNSVCNKLLLSLKTQFLQFNQTAIFFVPFNILLILLITKLVIYWRTKNYKGITHLLIPVLLVGGLFTMTVLHQNQFRYNHMIVPMLIFTLAIAYREYIAKIFSDRKYLVLFATSMMILAVVDFKLSQGIAESARDVDPYIRSIRAESAIVSDTTKVIYIFDSKNTSTGWTQYLSSTWALYPRPILLLDAKHLNYPEFNESIIHFAPQVLILQDTLSLKELSSLPYSLELVSKGVLRIYEITVNN
jgi:hypothetical protein